ncbi:thioredoxin family protein, partial [Myxococcota bacterium]|nr:thioredoxin family protein [Myxococcota bacterium]
LLLAHLIAIALLVWIFGSVQASLRLGWTRAVAVTSLVLAGLSLMALPLSSAPRNPSSGSTSGSDGIDWRVFDQGAIDRERAAGRPVFVDFTADWCITCQVNEALVLSDASVQEELARWDFATFKADWTLRDDAVTQGLAEWGRAGVPLYIVYPADPNEPPQLLPELLTLGETLKAIQAGGKGGGACGAKRKSGLASRVASAPKRIMVLRVQLSK